VHNLRLPLGVVQWSEGDAIRLKVLFAYSPPCIQTAPN
jgi:hypothetical protein